MCVYVYMLRSCSYRHLFSVRHRFNCFPSYSLFTEAVFLKLRHFQILWSGKSYISKRRTLPIRGTLQRTYFFLCRHRHTHLITCDCSMYTYTVALLLTCGMMCNSLSKHRLPTAWRSVHEHPSWRINANLFVQLEVVLEVSLCGTICVSMKQEEQLYLCLSKDLLFHSHPFCSTHFNLIDHELSPT